MKPWSTVLLASLLAFNLVVAIDATSIVLVVPVMVAEMGDETVQSFWIGASYLLSMCISQPIAWKFSLVFACRSTVLFSTMLVGIGSMVCERAQTMPLMLAGRSVQGLGAGGLTALSYALYARLESLEPGRGMGLVSAIALSNAVGTVCGPLIGAISAGNQDWSWIFRANIPLCLVLGAVVYSADDAELSTANPPRCSALDYVAVGLLASVLVPLSVGLSLAGTTYAWSDAPVVALIAVSGSALLLLVWRDVAPRRFLFGLGDRVPAQSLLGLRLFGSFHGASTFGGAIFLGALMYALLFFLPTYYRIVKSRSSMETALLLLPQTLTAIPCAGAVVAVERNLRLAHRWLLLSGWLCTACGIGLLTLLGADRSIRDDVLLNLPSGIGIGILLAVLVISARTTVNHADEVEPLVIVVFMRYLGSTLGLVVTNLVFRGVLQDHLEVAGVEKGIDRSTVDVAPLMYSIRMMPPSTEKTLHIQAVDGALRAIWSGLSIASFAVLLLSCSTIIPSLWRTTSPADEASTVDTNAALKLELGSIYKDGEAWFDVNFNDENFNDENFNDRMNVSKK